MSFFYSSREKQFWLCALVVLLTIIATLFLGQPLQEILKEQQLQAVFFLLCLGLTGLTILSHDYKNRPNSTKITVWLGITTVYLTLFLRLGLHERSHLIEYSVLAVFIHKALIERKKQKLLKTALTAFLITLTIGILDEYAQIYLPNRVFDWNDILFNTLAAFVAIGGTALLYWLKNKRI